MALSVCIGTYGDDSWIHLAQRAKASAVAAGATDIVHVHAATLSQARNDAASRAKNDWLCFLDADDELAPYFIEAIERRARYFPNADIIQVAALRIYEDGHLEGPQVYPKRNLSELNYLIVGCPWRREIFESVGGFQEWPVYEDWATLLNAERVLGRQLIVVEEPLAVYKVQVRQGSRNFPPRDVQERLHEQIRSTYA